MNEIVTIISTVGFPIAMCLGMAWFIVKQLQQLKDVVNNNTNVINMLISKMENKKDD